MTPKAKNNRNRFEGFLKTKIPASSDSSKYSRSLDGKIKRFYKEIMGQEYESIYELTDEDAIYKIKQDLATHLTMVYRPGRRGDSRIEGLDWYIEYLNSSQPTETPSLPCQTRHVRLATPEMEGKHIKKERTFIQRNHEARKKCIEHFGCKCAACGLVMSNTYGEIGEGFIEVHHLNPIHLFDDAHTVNYLTDLIPMCPNCHAMIHKLEDPGDIDVLRHLIKENDKSKS